MNIDNTGSLVFDTYFGNNQLLWMYSGIESTIKKKESAHSCALLLSTYTEILGGLITGHLKDIGHSKKNYEAFLSYLDQSYVDLHNQIDLYKRVRSAFVHEFSLKPSYAIWLTDNVTDKLGIEYIPDTDKVIVEDGKLVRRLTKGSLNFYVREYYRDFKNGVEKYRGELNTNKLLFINFIIALKINCDQTAHKPKNEQNKKKKST